MKGFYNGFAYMGFIPSIGKYWQFESESEYRNYLRERVKFNDNTICLYIAGRDTKKSDGKNKKKT